jgi:heme O synthase-like polyprenyltransferase
MKTSTASKHSINWFPILLVVVPCLWGMCFWLRDWPLAVITALISVYLVQDAWNLVKRKRAAQKESKLLREKVPRT